MSVTLLFGGLDYRSRNMGNMNLQDSFTYEARPTNLILAINNKSWPIVAAHDAHVTVLPSQLKSVGDFVQVWLEECQNDTESTGSVASLVIVVVDKYHCIHCRQLAPGMAVVLEVGQLLPVVLANDVTEALTVPEFRDSTHADIFVIADRLTNTQVDHLPSDNKTFMYVYVVGL